MRELGKSIYTFCRSHFFKILFGYLLFFVFAQYLINVIRSGAFQKHFPDNFSLIFAAKNFFGWIQQDHAVTLLAPADVAVIREPILNSSVALTTVFSAAYIVHETNATLQNTTIEIPLCPLVPPKLIGPLKVLMDTPSIHELEELFPNLEPGGRFYPKECKSRHRVAIVIPYRDRDIHLRIILHNLHFMLMRQQLDYGIYIVEEYGNTRFNRGMLMNIGYVEALKQHGYQCFIFHDVDLIPEDDRNIYSCPEQPRHMSVAVDIMGYRLPYSDLFGGVSALTREHMEKINGFPNAYWGWGGEDDDVSSRVRTHGYKISRYPANLARYKMLKHTKDKPNPDRYKILNSGTDRFKTDGLNNLNYTVRDLVLKKLYTWLLVEIAPLKNSSTSKEH